MKDHPYASENIKKEILEALRPVEPYKIVLFGSYARKDEKSNSDIDLYIVTGDDFIPGNFAEKMSIKTQVTKALRNLKKNMILISSFIQEKCQRFFFILTVFWQKK